MEKFFLRIAGWELYKFLIMLSVVNVYCGYKKKQNGLIPNKYNLKLAE